jgi:beta-glucanase (GH16 family)
MPVGQTGSWDMIFNDEFDGTVLDTNKWTTCYWWDWDNQGCTIGGNNEMEWYQPDDVIVTNGHLLLQARRREIVSNEGKIYPFTSGMISSSRAREDAAPPGLLFQYGYAEMKARLPAGKGLWAGFWMLPGNYESKPEIDIMEVLGHTPDTIHMTLHYQMPNGNEVVEGNIWIGPDLSYGWHTFAVDWKPDNLIWYVDGIEHWRYSDSAHIPNEPMYLVINLAVGGDWPGAPDSSTRLPSYFEIDYVRVWKRQGDGI